jgi:hypothetical protein
MKELIEHGVGVLTKRADDRVFIELVVTGKLTDQDYQLFIPVVEKALKEAKGLEVDLLVDMTAFKGWAELSAMVDDAKFGIKHLNDFDKIAVVGNKKWEEVAIKTWDLLTKSKVKFFKDRDKALKWLLKEKK